MSPAAEDMRYREMVKVWLILILIKSSLISTQKFARGMDIYDKTGYFQHPHCAFVWQYLCGNNDDSDFDARDSVTSVGFWKRATAPEMDAVCQVVSRYRLLDILAELLKTRSHYRLHSMDRVPLVKGIPTIYSDVCQ